jgi:drug/metabolite transporter (DMT)-like permease
MTNTDSTGSVVSAIGGAVVGYVLWLIAISIGNQFTTVSKWSLLVLLGSVVLAACAGLWGWSMRRRGKSVGAAFAFSLPVLPVVLTLAVLTNLYV